MEKFKEIAGREILTEGGKFYYDNIQYSTIYDSRGRPDAGMNCIVLNGDTHSAVLLESGLAVSAVAMKFEAPLNGMLGFLDRSLGLYGFCNEKLELVLPAIYKNIGKFISKTCVVSIVIGGVEYYGKIDMAGETVIPFLYKRLYSITKKLHVAVTFADKYGVLDKTGNVLVPFEYEKISAFRRYFTTAVKNGKVGIITKSAVIFPFIADDIDLGKFTVKIVVGKQKLFCGMESASDTSLGLQITELAKHFDANGAPINIFVDVLNAGA